MSEKYYKIFMFKKRIYEWTYEKLKVHLYSAPFTLNPVQPTVFRSHLINTYPFVCYLTSA